MKSFIGAVIFICVALSANAQLLWKVSGNGLSSPSYIMGTHHLAPLSVKDGITGLQKAMDETQQVYGELKMSDIQSPATIQGAAPSKPNNVNLPHFTSACNHPC